VELALGTSQLVVRNHWPSYRRIRLRFMRTAAVRSFRGGRKARGL